MTLDLLEELLSKGKRATVRVRGGSMRPALQDGDVVTLAPGFPRKGELAAARAGDELVIHRVLATRGAQVLLCGDAVARPDGLFTPLGRVERVRRGESERAPHRSVARARLGRLLRRLLHGS